MADLDVSPFEVLGKRRAVAGPVSVRAVWEPRPVSEKPRKCVDEWFSRYPELERDELRAAFRSDIDSQHLAAFFELYLHELLLRLECTVAIHPVIPGVSTRPDFLVTDAAGGSFVLEATVCTDSDDASRAEARRMAEALDALNNVDSPNFMLWVEAHAAGPRTVSTRRLQAFARAFVANLDPDDIADKRAAGHDWDLLPAAHFQEDGWSIVLRPLPKAPDKRGPGRSLGISGPGEAELIKPASALKRSILRKASRYGQTLDLPFVIAVNAVSTWVNFDHEMEALFGEEVIRFSPGMSEPEPHRRLNGAWTGLSAPAYRRNSAVLFVGSLSAGTVGTASAELVHHPYAVRPYSSVLTVLPQRVPAAGRITFIPGQQPWAILGLAEGWPFHERRRR